MVPPAEAASTEEGLPPAKRSKSEEQKVLIRAKDSEESEVGLLFDRSALQSDYFKEGLERWKTGHEVPIFELVLPRGSVASKGLELLKKRLLSQSRVVGQGDVWSSAAWWKASDGQGSALLTVLYIFDHIMRTDYRKEVATAVRTFRLPLPEPYLSILRQDEPYWADEWSPSSDALNITTSERDLVYLINNAIDRRGDAIVLAERAIGGHPEGTLGSHLYDALMREVFTTSNSRTRPGWLLLQIERITRKSFVVADKLFELLLRDKRLNIETAVLADIVVNSIFHGVLLKIIQGSGSFAQEEEESIARFLFRSIGHFEEIGLFLDPMGPPYLECPCLVDLFEVSPPVFQSAMLEGATAFANRQRDHHVRNDRQAGSEPIPCVILMLKDRVRLVAPQVRQVLFRWIHALSDADNTFLSQADFPASSQAPVCPQT